MPPPPPLPPELLRRNLPLLCAALALAVTPLAAELPLAMPAFVWLACGWRLAALYRRVPLPSRISLFLLALAGAGLVYLHFHKFYGREGGTALLLVGLGLKLLEMRSLRDLYLVVYLALFVAVTVYLFSQSIPIAVYTLGVVTLLVASLIGLNGGENLNLTARLWLGAKLVMQAVPVMVVLFLFLPRIAGPLWKLPEDEPGGRTGLSDSMEPGAISRLGLSRETAFRVDFEGALPPPRERYWRGPVFWRYDGRRWSAGYDEALPARRPPQTAGASYRYALTLEPHRRRWVFPLETAETFPAELTRAEDGFLLAAEPVRERRRYVLSSRPEASFASLSESERRRGLQIPGMPNPRVKELVESWLLEDPAAEAMAKRALRHFREEPFGYSLRPPPIGGEPVAGFLFETRRGFCEHYAGAFVYLMRVAGIPARVVTGYQGGHWNPVGRFLEVAQADAHAWAEIWLDGPGWTRIDPTAAVAPERIERELEFLAGADGAVVFANPVAEALGERLSSLRGLMREAGLLWGAVDHAWVQWVLAYGPENQSRFLERLGVVDWNRLVYWLTGLLGLLALVSFVLLWPRSRPAADPALRLYLRVAGKLERQGLVRAPAEGMRDFAARVARARPDLAESFGRFTALFLAIRYGGTAQAAALERLKALGREIPSRQRGGRQQRGFGDLDAGAEGVAGAAAEAPQHQGPQEPCGDRGRQ
jgi:transglutaminase-like putative cysteine protease